LSSIKVPKTELPNPAMKNSNDPVPKKQKLAQPKTLKKELNQ